MPDPSASAPTPPSTAAPSTPPDPPRRENIKETIESILVAFILAFVFRAFVVEAFVIPSGSMAPTLLGAHLRFRCQDCGYPFDVNLSVEPQHASIPAAVPPMFSMHCPNCGYKVRRLNESTWEGAQPIDVRYGDRILVLKYLSLIQKPKRWDVVVFKTPSEPDHQTNYIKRLVGLPGETVMLLDGDVYTRPNDWTGHADQGWQIQRKPRVVQDALWRIVYHNDFQPTNGVARPWTMPWKSRGAGWDTGSTNDNRRIWRFDNASGAASLTFDPDANLDQPNRSAFPFTDWLPYNETRQLSIQVNRQLKPHTDDHYKADRYRDDDIARWHVGDIELRFMYARASGDGPLRATLTKFGHTFIAEFTPGKVRLLHTPPRGIERDVTSAEVSRGHAPLRVEFANVDHQVTLCVDGNQLITHPYDPNLRDLLLRHERRLRLDKQDHRDVFERPTVALSASMQSCTITHASLWRDIYYTPSEGYGQRPINGAPGHEIVLHVDGEPMSDKDRMGFAPRTHENEYFVLGDNSGMSGDARTWSQPVQHVATEDLLAPPGRVPERFMLGKAFFVYWPAGYHPFPSAPGLVPNFGEMRFIH